MTTQAQDQPYLKTGRGGAGNFFTQSTAEDVSLPLEQPAKPRAQSTGATAPSLPQYATSGRGGAGNWFSPPDLQEKGTFSDAASDTLTPTTAHEEALSPLKTKPFQIPLMSGRGGAGNYSQSAAARQIEAEAHRAQEHEKSEKRLEVVVRDVEKGLQAPQPAYLLSGRGRIGSLGR